MLPLKDTDAIVVGIGENEGVNIMVTALLKDVGANRLICRVTSKLQKTILEAMNIQEFIEPEADSAERLAYKLDLKSVKDSFRVSEDYHMLKVTVSKRFVQKKVSEMELPNKYGLQLVTILRAQPSKNVFGTMKDEVKVLRDFCTETHIKENDTLLIYGSNDDLERFVKETL
jgi:trk system potassium uptake protein TrkA